MLRILYVYNIIDGVDGNAIERKFNSFRVCVAASKMNAKRKVTLRKDAMLDKSHRSKRATIFMFRDTFWFSF